MSLCIIPIKGNKAGHGIRRKWTRHFDGQSEAGATRNVRSQQNIIDFTSNNVTVKMTIPKQRRDLAGQFLFIKS